MSVGQLPSNHPYSRRFVAAGQEVGLELNADFNGASIDGVGFYDMNIDEGRRITAAHAFLLPVLTRKNLRLLTDARVVELVMDGTRCTGVRVSRGESTTIAYSCSSDVILSAGVINSPEILLRSGIGDARDLRKLGIPVACDLRGVGRNLVDHVMVRNIVFETMEKSPPISANSSEAHALWKSDPALDMPDVQFLFTQIPLGAKDVPMNQGYAIVTALARPASVGTVRLESADPGSKPLIDPNYLADESDVRKLSVAIEFAREIGNAGSFGDIRRLEASPGRLGQKEKRDFIKENCSTYWHPVGTCRMGEDQDAVVDTFCRVRGIEGLRVVDASVMPRITTTNTNAPTMMIAQRASALILAGK